MRRCAREYFRGWNLWQSEGLVVLAWALGHAELPAYYAQCEPSDIANQIGFLGSRETTALHEPRLRDSAEIEKWVDTRPDRPRVAHSADVYVDREGLMYVTDFNAGLHILEYKGS